MDKDRQLYQLHEKGYEKIAKAIEEVDNDISIEVNGAEVVTYQGKPGKDAPPVDDGRLIKLIKPLIPDPIPGPPGPPGKPGTPGKTSDMNKIVEAVSEIVTARIPTVENIVEKIPKPKNGEDGTPGKDGSPDTPEQVKSKLLEVGLSYKDIKDAPKPEDLQQRIFPKGRTDIGEINGLDTSQTTVQDGKVIIPPVSVSGGTWTTYVPTITGVTSDPTKGTVAVDQASYFVSGKMMTINYFYKHTAGGAAGSGAYKYSIPAGYTIDTTKLTTYSSQSPGYANNIGATVIGSANVNNGSQGLPSVAFAGDSTNILIAIYIAINDMRLTGSSIIALSGTTVQYSFSVIIPIV